MRRSSGILLHLTSLPGPHGSGDLGPEAHSFLAWLASAGQTWWQMLPVGPVSSHPGNCPYVSSSSRAGNPLLVSLEALCEQGLLKRSELRVLPRGHVRFPEARRYRNRLLRKASRRFRPNRNFEQFVDQQRSWLDDYALFQALKDSQPGTHWTDWSAELRHRRPEALQAARQALAEEIRHHQFVQYQFHRQWQSLRCEARRLQISLIGDMPLFVAHDSVDVWCNQRLFLLDASGRPRRVSGYPPDFFSKTGQRWGHPLFDWREHARQGYALWVERFDATLQRFDAVRIDHFLGMTRLWSIPVKDATAEHGRWMRTPGRQILLAVNAALAAPLLLPEDLGNVTRTDVALRRYFGLPTMRILQFDLAGVSEGRPRHNCPSHCVAYTGTHDNNTLVGWFGELSVRARRRVQAYLGDGPIHWAAMHALLQSPAEMTIVPMQDLLGLPAKARMNLPGKAAGNWRWRVEGTALTPALAEELRKLTESSNRLIPPAAGPPERQSSALPAK